jgi:hypothetical protein
MKKLLVLAVAIMTTGAFAQKSMIRFSGIDSGSRANSFDLSMRNNDNDASKTDWTHINLNYAYTVAPQIQVGLGYQSLTGENAGTDVDANRITVSGYYNFMKDIKNSNYVALHYGMASYGEAGAALFGFNSAAAKDDSETTITLEYGKRWHIGTGWGFHLTYAPSVQYAMNTLVKDAAGQDDVTTNDLSWNFVKFDVMF